MIKHKKILITSTIIVLIDIISKLLISSLLIENQSIKIINKFFYLTYAKNIGVAFSFLEGNRILIILATIIIIGIIIKYIYKRELLLLDQISFGLILGGAIGNLIDRIIYGYVIDFLDFRIFNYSYPIFNIADSSIVILVLLLLLINIKKESSEKHGDNSKQTRTN